MIFIPPGIFIPTTRRDAPPMTNRELASLTLALWWVIAKCFIGAALIVGSLYALFYGLVQVVT